MIQKQAWTWTTPRFPEPARMTRWGHFGTPVLIFPTAGGDFEEIERFHLIDSLGELIERGRLKAYSVDGVWARAWLSGQTPAALERLYDGYDSFLYEEALPRIRQDCRDPRIEPVLVGASLGASLSIGTLCRHPDSFRAAIGMSGIYHLTQDPCANAGAQQPALAPLAGVAHLSGQPLERLRRRPIILGSGEGEYENSSDSRRLSEILAAQGVACRLSLWGPERDHTWSTWRALLPATLADQL